MNYIIKSLFVVCIFSQAFGQTNRYTLPLRYLDAENVTAVLNAIIQAPNEDLSITFNKSKANDLIVMTSDENYQILKKFIEEIDVPLPNGEIIL